jgi:hypothetical protein
MSFTRYNCVSREIQGRREVSTISYNKLGYITQSFLPDNKAKKEILV